MQHVRFLICLLLVFLTTSNAIFAQSLEPQTRPAQWDAYNLPEGKFTRYLDQKKGFSLWRPADWKQEAGAGSGIKFTAPDNSQNFLVLTEPLPEGYGVANYLTGMMQGFRKQPVNLDSIVIRKVLLGGVEGREISLDLETAKNTVVHQTYWVTQVGPLAYCFVFSVTAENQAKYEPAFKRIIMSVRFNSNGHWDEEIERLRIKFAEGESSEFDAEASKLSETIRTAKEPTETVIKRLIALSEKAPAIVLETLMDYDPNVRAAVITALGNSSDNKFNDALVWALNDKDVFCSMSAAQALANRGASLAVIKNQLPKLIESNGALLRLASVLTDEKAREIAEELLRSENADQQLAGLQLAVVLPLKGLHLPYAKLFSTSEVQIIGYTMEAIRLRHPAEDVPELVAMIGTDKELWAAHALGELATPAIESPITDRLKGIEIRYEKLLKAKGVITVRGGMTELPSGNNNIPPPPPPPMPRTSRSKNSGKTVPRGIPGGIPAIFDSNNSSAASTPPTVFKTQPELTQLWSVAGELKDALAKIGFRDRWAKAKDEAARREIRAEAEKNEHLKEWIAVTLKSTPPASTGATIKAERLKDISLTGENLFPANATLYLTAPNFEQTINKLESALSGIQMGTVRDQMSFALMLNSLKAQMTSKMNIGVTGSASQTLGIDLQSPISMASWPDQENKSSIAHSAVIVRVTDRARFERTLTLYQNDFGSFDSFVPVVSAGARFASITPAVLPVVMYAMASIGDFAGTVISTSQSKRSAYRSFGNGNTSYLRQEKIGDWPVTIFEKLGYVGIDSTKQEQIYVAYLGNAAVLATSREALLEALKTDKQTIAGSKLYNRVKSDFGEILFFSQLDVILKNFFAEISGEAKKKDPEDAAFNAAISKALGSETGVVRLSPNAWDSIFHLPSEDNDLVKALRPFKATELTAPRDLLPKNTLIYAATVIEPNKFVDYLARWEAELEKARKDAGSVEKKDETSFSKMVSQLQKLLMPHLQGEVSFALLNVSNIFTGKSGLPSMVLALKLKDDKLAKIARSGLASVALKRVPNAMVMNSPVFALSDENDKYFATATDGYFVVADSLETLKLLEEKEKFATSREFVRPAGIAPERLAFFSTYNLDAAFEDARKALGKTLTKDESIGSFIDMMSAWSHAFHSQRILVAFADDKTLEGRLGISFDREGRYNVGAMNRDEFDLENALVAPKGLSISKPTQTEFLKIKISAKQPGVIPRVGEDLTKFSWQKIETGATDSTLVFTTMQRRIPDRLTIKLPVKSPEFEAFLKPTIRINSTSPEIVKLAQEIAGKDRDGRSVAKKIGNWTYENLKWKRVESTTVQTLASREADCLEHAELYVALARAQGLPARVVSGAAYGGGSFGAHAWVEIYLGQWVEIDPTWGLTDHVDATHLRFDKDGFISYAQLNQVDFEILEARNVVADFQRDPVQLVREFGTHSSENDREMAFNFDLTVDQVFGKSEFAKFTPKQRSAVIKVFERAVADISTEWFDDWDDHPSIVSKEIKSDRAEVLAVFGGGLIRLSLTARNGAWYVTEIENVDEESKTFAEPMRAAIDQTNRLAKIRDLQTSDPVQAIDEINRLIAVKGESAPLLLLKARALKMKKIQDELEAVEDGKEKSKERKAENKVDESLELMKQITIKWPDYAPAQYALGTAYAADENLREKALSTLQRYAQLMPVDPRPWIQMGDLYESLKRMNEAENALTEVIARDKNNVNSSVKLLAFYFRSANPEKSKTTLSTILKQFSETNQVFAAVNTQLLYGEDEISMETARQFEELILNFPKEVTSTEAGLHGLSDAQRAQKKYDAAIKTLQKSLTLNPSGTAQLEIAGIYREARRFPQALAAADLSIKQNSEDALGHFERACALTQLGRKREALSALKKALEYDGGLAVKLEGEEDLKPLSTLPEFKALLPKKEEQSESNSKPEQSQAAKP